MLSLNLYATLFTSVKSTLTKQNAMEVAKQSPWQGRSRCLLEIKFIPLLSVVHLRILENESQKVSLNAGSSSYVFLNTQLDERKRILFFDLSEQTHQYFSMSYEVLCGMFLVLYFRYAAVLELSFNAGREKNVLKLLNQMRGKHQYNLLLPLVNVSWVELKCN